LPVRPVGEAGGGSAPGRIARAAIHETAAMNDQWKSIRQDALAKRNAVNRGTVAFGDGIHHFENFVLRGDD
jgi:methyl-accepting chemotaxis protein